MEDEEVEEEECMEAMVEVEDSMATTTMVEVVVVLVDEVVTMIGAKGLERIWMDLLAG